MLQPRTAVVAIPVLDISVLIEIDHEIICTVILPFLLFKECSCQLLVKVCVQVLAKHIED